MINKRCSTSALMFRILKVPSKYNQTTKKSHFRKKKYKNLS